jgi:hypothetical protein
LINQIDARLLFSDTTSIEYSIWSADLSTQLFSQWFNVADLTRIALGAEQFETSAFLTGLNLNAGTYYLSIYDGGDPTSTLGWYNTVTVDGSGLQTIGADPFSDAIGGGNGKDFAFKIYDSTAVSVPEPSIIALLSLGLLGIVFARRKA